MDNVTGHRCAYRCSRELLQACRHRRVHLIWALLAIALSALVLADVRRRLVLARSRRRFIQFNSLLPCLQLPLYTRTVRDPDSNCFEDRYRRPRWGRGRGGESSTCSTRNRRCGRVCVRHSWRSCWAQAECAMTPRCRPRPELRSHHAAPHRAACHPVLVHCWDLTGIAAGKSASGAAASHGAGPRGR
jgi:hypothetical protein